jgi:hypothetical protein
MTGETTAEKLAAWPAAGRPDVIVDDLAALLPLLG